jgi:ABC-type uncharacterized transport system ATPase subunit
VVCTLNLGLSGIVILCAETLVMLKGNMITDHDLADFQEAAFLVSKYE